MGASSRCASLGPPEEGARPGKGLSTRLLLIHQRTPGDSSRLHSLLHRLSASGHRVVALHPQVSALGCSPVQPRAQATVPVLKTHAKPRRENACRHKHHADCGCTSANLFRQAPVAAKRCGCKRKKGISPNKWHVWRLHLACQWQL